MNSIAQIYEVARNLPEGERAALAHQLLLTLEDPEPMDEDYETAWATELDERLARIASGNYSARPWREALESIRKSLEPRPST